MDKTGISVRINDLIGILQAAVDQKGPYYLGINGRYTQVSRGEFLEFNIDWTISQLDEIHEELNDNIKITDLPDGGCIVEMDGETTLHSREEVEEMKQDYNAAVAQVNSHSKGGEKGNG